MAQIIFHAYRLSKTKDDAIVLTLLQRTPRDPQGELVAVVACWPDVARALGVDLVGIANSEHP